MYTRNKFTFAENRKIDKTLAVMKKFAEKDNFLQLLLNNLILQEEMKSMICASIYWKFIMMHKTTL